MQNGIDRLANVQIISDRCCVSFSRQNDKGAVTLIDVAKHAGVSPMTVSRVLNDAGKVRESTRERVLASVSSLNYSPNQAARNLVSGKGRRICLLYGNPSSAYLERLLLGALKAAGRLGLQLEVKNVAEDISPEKLKHDLLHAWDGLIIPPPISDVEGIRRMLEAEGFPAVFIGSVASEAPAHEIRINDEQASFEMTEYLINLGHKRIGFVKGHPNHSTSALRERGYEAALEKAGLTVDRGLTALGFFTYRSGMDAGLQLLRAEKPPTAIFASNDDMAAGVMAAAAKMGVQVPEDLSVAGFDDSPIATIIWPNLTTVGQPLFDLAGQAVQVLDSIMERDPKTDKSKSAIYLEHSLMKRESVTPPR